MIVFGIGVLLARATFPAFGVSLTLAWSVFALAAAWYMTRGNIVSASPSASPSAC